MDLDFSNENIAGKKSFLSGTVFTNSGLSKVKLPYISIGQQEQVHVTEFRKLVEAAAKGNRDPRAWELYLRRHQHTILKQGFILAAENKRIDPVSAAEDTFRRLGFNEFESMRVRFVTSSNIPLDQKAIDRHTQYLLDQAAGGDRAKNARSPFTNFDAKKGVIKQVDTDLTGYYHLERGKEGTHNILYINDVMGGSIVTDMDADEANVLIMRQRAADGKIVREELISLKEPITQAMFRFRSLQTAPGVGDFNKKDLFNISSIDIGRKLDPHNFREVAPGKLGTRIFSSEEAAGQFSVLGDLYRLRGSKLSNVEAVRDIATKELQDPLTGIITNLHDLQAMYAAAIEVNDLKTNDPAKFQERLLLTQKMAAEQLENAKNSGKTRATHKKFFDFYESAMGDIVDRNGSYNQSLELLLQTDAVAKKMVDASNPNRLFDVEIRMKALRGGQGNIQDRGILDTFNMMLKHNQLLFKTNSISNMSHADSLDLLNTLTSIGGSTENTMRDVFGAASIDDFQKRTRTLAEAVLNKKTKAVEQIEYDPANTILKRLMKAGVVDLESINIPSKYARQDLLGTGYTNEVHGLMFRGLDGVIDHPFGADNVFEIPLIGNMGIREEGNRIKFRNPIEHIEQLLEESSTNSMRSFMSTTGFYSHTSIGNALINGHNGKSQVFREQLMSAYGLTNEVDASALGREILAGGHESAQHMEIIKRFNLMHNQSAFSAIKQQTDKILEAHGFKTMNPVRIIDGNIVDIGEADMMRAATTVGVDLRVTDPNLEMMADTAANYAEEVGGIHMKSTSSMNNRVMQFRLGAAAGSFAPIGLNQGIGVISAKSASRAANISKQIGGGGIMLGELNVAFGDSQVAHPLFSMYDLTADVGTKRADEGLILVSESFRDKLLEKVMSANKIGPNLTEEEYFTTGRESFVKNMMSGFEASPDSFLTEGEQRAASADSYSSLFDRMYERVENGDKVRYVLTEEGKNFHTSQTLKLDSLWGNKAVSVVHGDFGVDPTGRPIDIFVSMNQVRSRESVGQTYGAVLETAVRSGRLDPTQYPEIFEQSGGDWRVIARESVEGLENVYADALEKARYGATISFGGEHNAVNMFHAYMDDIAVSAVHADKYATKEVNTFLRSNSALKVMGQMSHIAETLASSDVGQGVVGAGLQIAVATVAQQLQKGASQVIGHSNQTMTHASFMASSRRIMAEATGKAAALAETAVEQASTGMNAPKSAVGAVMNSGQAAAEHAVKTGKINPAIPIVGGLGLAGYGLANSRRKKEGYL